jgi:hypothetical protein
LHIEIEAEDVLSHLQRLYEDERAAEGSVLVDEHVVGAGSSHQQEHIIPADGSSPSDVQQGRRLHRLHKRQVLLAVQFGNCNGALRVGVGLVVGKREEILLEGTGLDAVDAEGGEPMSCKVEHNIMGGE